MGKGCFLYWPPKTLNGPYMKTLNNIKQTRIKKQQDDRLLKRLSREERRRQEELRRLIVIDPLFKTI
jgi:hypothetical protein